jgi:hypothetical protein
VTQVANDEFENLRNASIAIRFAAAKKLADSPQDIEQKLKQWLPIARSLLLDAVANNPSKAPKLLNMIKALQEVSYALQTSNINPRLALERLFLEI